MEFLQSKRKILLACLPSNIAITKALKNAKVVIFFPSLILSEAYTFELQVPS